MQCERRIYRSLRWHTSGRESVAVYLTDLSDSRLPLASNISFEQAAGFCITYATSLYAMKQRAHLQAGETVVVLGAAGGVGVTAIQIAKAMGARVIAAASTEEKLDFACEVGADYRINYSPEDLKTRIKELPDGRGADVIYDAVGGDYTEQAYRAIAWCGRYLVIDFAASATPKIPLNLPLLKAGVYWEISALGDLLMDLGNALAYWLEVSDTPALQALVNRPSQLPGMLTRAEVLSYYAEKTGRSVANFYFYLVAGYFRNLVITQQIYYRFYHGQTSGPRFAAFAGAIGIIGDHCRKLIAASHL